MSFSVGGACCESAGRPISASLRLCDKLELAFPGPENERRLSACPSCIYGTASTDFTMAGKRGGVTVDSEFAAIANEAIR